MGSFALTLVRLSGQPILLFRPRANAEPPAPAQGVIRTVVVPVDGGAYSELIIPHAVQLARAANASIQVVQVLHVDGQLSTGCDRVGLCAAAGACD